MAGVEQAVEVNWLRATVYGESGEEEGKEEGREGGPEVGWERLPSPSPPPPPPTEQKTDPEFNQKEEEPNYNMTSSGCNATPSDCSGSSPPINTSVSGQSVPLSSHSTPNSSYCLRRRRRRPGRKRPVEESPSCGYYEQQDDNRGWFPQARDDNNEDVSDDFLGDNEDDSLVKVERYPRRCRIPEGVKDCCTAQDVTPPLDQEQQTREINGSEGESIPVKKPKKSCRYLEKWDSEFTFLQRSSIGPSYAFCKICNCDFSIAHGGKNDVSHHEKSSKHKRWLEVKKNGQAMPAFVTRTLTEADQVLNAEVKMALLCTKNNISFAFCDDFIKCVADMFPDSPVAQKCSAGKIKATQLVKDAEAAELDDELAKACRSQPFSLMCDALNSRKMDKALVILTRLYDEATLQVITRFMEMPICNMGNAEDLYENLSEALRKRGIPWENLIAFNSDNVGVISRLKTSQPHVLDLGCVCHLTQMAAGCAIRAVQVPVEDILFGIYTHFDKSSKRCEISKELVDFTDSDHLKLLRYCSTRWLSLLPCIQRVLNKWDALQAHFNSREEVEKSAKIHDLANHLRDPVVKIYFMFLTSALKHLSEFNIAFQSEEVLIHRLEEEMCRLIRRILGYLIPARAIVGVPLWKVEYGEGQQLADEDLFIGADTKAFMKSIALPLSAEKKIFQSVRRFYEAALQAMLSFPLDHPLLRDLKMLDPSARHTITPEIVKSLAVLFPQLGLSEDGLKQELINYKATDSEQLPQEDKIDRFWGQLGKDESYSELPRLMKALLCIPHSNASSERVFGLMREIVYRE